MVERRKKEEKKNEVILSLDTIIALKNPFTSQ